MQAKHESFAGGKSYRILQRAGRGQLREPLALVWVMPSSAGPAPQPAMASIAASDKPVLIRFSMIPAVLDFFSSLLCNQAVENASYFALGNKCQSRRLRVNGVKLAGVPAIGVLFAGIRRDVAFRRTRVAALRTGGARPHEGAECNRGQGQQRAATDRRGIWSLAASAQALAANGSASRMAAMMARKPGLRIKDGPTSAT